MRLILPCVVEDDEHVIAIGVARAVDQRRFGMRLDRDAVLLRGGVVDVDHQRSGEDIHRAGGRGEKIRAGQRAHLRIPESEILRAHRAIDLTLAGAEPELDRRRALRLDVHHASPVLAAG